jgi:hypothetical protein
MFVHHALFHPFPATGQLSGLALLLSLFQYLDYPKQGSTWNPQDTAKGILALQELV